MTTLHTGNFDGFTDAPEPEDYGCQMCGAPGGYPYCANNGPISCADAAADNDDTTAA